MVGSVLSLVAMLFGISGQILGVGDETDEDKVRDFFDDNISVMAETYSDKFGTTWDPGTVGSVKRIADGAGGFVGYLVSFDKGYIGYSSDDSILCMETVGSPCLAEGQDHYDSSSWGNYEPICIDQGQMTDCGVCASINLLYTEKVSGTVDLTKRESLSTLRNELDVDEKWKVNIALQGILPTDLLSDFNQFLQNTGYYIGTGYSNYNPAIGCFFSADIADTGHYALIVAKGESDYWWIFKSYWDVIETWYRNYPQTPNGVPANWYPDDYGSLRIVDNQYLKTYYVLMKGATVI